MDSKREHSGILKLLGLAILVCLLGPSASAAPRRFYEGNFTLPFEVHWGGKILNPGTYCVTVDSANPYRITLRGESGPEIVMPRAILATMPAHQTALIVARQGRVRTARAIHLAQSHLVLYLGGGGEQNASRQLGPIERVPISPVVYGACPDYCIG